MAAANKRHLQIGSPSSPLYSLRRRIPIINWLPQYSRSHVIPDLIAGVTLGLTVIPQSMGYAKLAGLEPQYGLYSSFVGSFLYSVFGTVPQVNLGPKAILALLTFNHTHRLGPHFAILLCFLSGCLELLCGLLNLGVLVDFVSTPVVSGFTSAAALTAACSQIKGIFGISFKSESFLDTWIKLFRHIEELRLWDTVLGLASCCALQIIKIGKEKIDHAKQSGDKRKLLRIFWFICLGRNALIVLLGGGLAGWFENSRSGAPFKLTGIVAEGLPSFQLPPFSGEVNNRTMEFPEVFKILAPGTVATAVVAIISNLAIGKAFADGGMLDATQEMVTLGLCNIAGSFVGSMPVAGAFSRSAISNASGVRSPFSGIYSGIMVVLALYLLTPYFYYIPQATLSAVVFMAAQTLVDFSIVPRLWKTNKRDVVPFIATFLSCLLLGLELGILIGVLIDVAGLLFANARPKLNVDVLSFEEISYIMVTPNVGLLFPAADHFRSRLNAASSKNSNHLPVVFDCSHVHRTDYTAAMSLNSLAKEVNQQGRELILLKVRPEILQIWSMVRTYKHAKNEKDLIETLRENRDLISIS